METLLTSDVPLKEIEPFAEQDKKLSKAFIHNQPMIDMYALTETSKIGIPIEFSSIAIQQLGNNLGSALSLGSIEALEVEKAWIEGLLREHNQNIESLDSFFAAYAKSIDSAMGEEGRPISTWLRTQINGKK